MLAVLHDPFQHRPKLRSADGFLVPFRQNYRGDVDVLGDFLSRMAGEKEAVEKGRLALRIFEFLQRVFDRVCQRRHNGKPQFTDFNATVKSPRREIANKLLNAFQHWTVVVERKLLPIRCWVSNRFGNCTLRTHHWMRHGSQRCRHPASVTESMRRRRKGRGLDAYPPSVQLSAI